MKGTEMRRFRIVVNVVLTVMATGAAIVTSYAAIATSDASRRISETHEVWAALELDEIDPIKRGFKGIGVGKHDVTITLKDGSIILAVEIIQVDYGGVYLRAKDSVFIIRYSEIVSIATESEIYE